MSTSGGMGMCSAMHTSTLTNIYNTFLKNETHCAFNYPGRWEYFPGLLWTLGILIFALQGNFLSSENPTHRGLELLLKSVAIPPQFS